MLTDSTGLSLSGKRVAEKCIDVRMSRCLGVAWRKGTGSAGQTSFVYTYWLLFTADSPHASPLVYTSTSPVSRERRS